MKKKNRITKDWLYAVIVRAVKTMAQTALGVFTVGATMEEIKWSYVVSISLTAGIYSVLTSIATGLPEIENGSNVKKNRI